MRHIKRYANRKLYDTTDSQYVRLGDIAKMVRTGEEFVVVDNETGTDLTAQTLAQIIMMEQQEKPSVATDVLVSVIRQGIPVIAGKAA